MVDSEISESSVDNQTGDVVDVDRDEFYRRLYEVFNNKKTPNSVLLSREKYNWIIERIKAAKTTLKKTPADYHRMKRFEVVKTSDGDKLYTQPTPGNNRRQLMVPLDEMYDIIQKYHLKLNHCGRNRMREELKRMYRNITAESILVYLSMCKSCKNKSINKRAKRNPSISQTFESIEQPFSQDFSPTRDPIAECSSIKLDFEAEELIRELNTTTYKYPELYSRGQVDILGVTNELEEEYKYLMVYRSFTTKYIHLKPLKALSVDEAVEELLAIFLEYGAPNILQSKNGMDLIRPICRRISNSHQEIKVLASEKVFNKTDFNGKSNEDILKRLNDWLVKSQNTKWHQGVKYVQHEFNTTFHESLCRTPSEMIFGTNPRKGLASVLSKNVCEDLVTEQDLITVLENKDTVGPKRLKIEETLILPSNFIKSEADTDDEIVSEDDELIA